MIRSPFLCGCFGNGKPSPWILFVELGLIMSVIVNESLLPSMVGTVIVAPTNACKNNERG